MKSNLLILNPDKTEVVHFISRHKRVVEELESLRVGESDISPSSSVRNLGVLFESSGDMLGHVNQICKSAYFALHRIGKNPYTVRPSCYRETCPCICYIQAGLLQQCAVWLS